VARLRGERVRLRDWRDEDLAPFAALNADPEVMRHFPRPLTREESDAVAARIRTGLAERGYGWWALEVPGLGFAGFVGVGPVPFEAPFNRLDDPVLEVGWRLARAAWGHGYATEGARLALAHAFDVLGAAQVVSFTTTLNLPSQLVMQRLGMRPDGDFDHPRLPEGHPQRRHLLYRLAAEGWRAQRASLPS
jgi:RimJ/RimL family protein N-acetyltransferase